MSPRAACRLETLGFRAVFDYVAGKSDWLARGLPTEGAEHPPLRVHRLASAAVVTAAPGEGVDAVAARLAASSFPFALVTADDGTLLGRLPQSTIERSAGRLAGDVMEPGPSTIRADTTVVDLLERLRARELDFAIVTTPEGRLIGVVRRDDLEHVIS